LIPLKRNWLRKESPKNNPEPDLFKQLKGEIAVLRKQGEPPEKDPHSFARYICDLCNSPHPVTGLRQCVVCGRWACADCWKDEFYTCKSCAGIIKIHAIRQKQS
jgi:hypothetical protein